MLCLQLLRVYMRTVLLGRARCDSPDEPCFAVPVRGFSLCAPAPATTTAHALHSVRVCERVTAAPDLLLFRSMPTLRARMSADAARATRCPESTVAQLVDTTNATTEKVPTQGAVVTTRGDVEVDHRRWGFAGKVDQQDLSRWAGDRRPNPTSCACTQKCGHTAREA